MTWRFSPTSLRVRIQFREPHYGSPRMQSIYAEGSVDFRRGDVHITCEALYIDGITEQGLAIAARVRTHEPTRHLPIQFVADAIRDELDQEGGASALQARGGNCEALL